MKNKIYAILTLVLLSLPTQLFAITMPQFNLYYQAESYISSSQVESTVTVGSIVKNYQKLQVKWLGEAQAKLNQETVQTNPLFAKTILTQSNPSKDKLAAKVKFMRVKYTTPNPDGMQKVSGLLIMPPTKEPKGIILFFHSTITGKLNVPSLKFNDYKAQMLAAIFAADGYIVAGPDYIGLGDNYKETHPYILYPQMNVEDGKNMLIAVHKYLLEQHYTKPLDLYVSGYSEGSSYALWFSRIYQENKSFAKQLNHAGFNLKKTVAIDGAYNLTDVMFPFLLTNQVNVASNPFNIHTSLWGTLLKPSLLAQVMLSYAYYNHKNIRQLLNPSFFTMDCGILAQYTCGQNELNQYNLDSIMVTPAKTFVMALKYFFAANFKSANGLMYSVFSNSVRPLLAAGVISDSELLKTAAKANILRWKSTSPITLISLQHDSLVPEKNSADAYTGMLESGSTQVRYLKVENTLLKGRALWGYGVVDHVSFELYALLIALNEFNNTPRVK